MSDDVTLPGTGADVATDEIGGKHFQRIKLVHGADGTNAGDVAEANPLPVTQRDCTSLLSTTISATGTGTSIDTKGYGAVVVQLSGTWTGSLTFESSNDETAWDSVLVFSRDDLSLRDIVSSNGLYTIRPSGRYLRTNTANITGTITVVALGRSAEGIDAADLLSAAMDDGALTPMNVKAHGSYNRPQAQDIAGNSYVLPVVRNAQFYFTTSGQVYEMPCADMTSAMVWCQVSNLNIKFELLVNGVWTNTLNQPALTMNGGNATLGTVYSGDFSSALIVNLYGATRIRFRATTTNAAGSSVTVQLSPFPIPTHMIISGALGSVYSVTEVLSSKPATPTVLSLNSAASTNATSVKGSAGTLYGLVATNNGAAVCFLKLYNKATAPTVGTDTPISVISIPANGVPVQLDWGALGYRFSTGIAYAITNLIGDADTTAIAAGQVKLSGSYI